MENLGKKFRGNQTQIKSPHNIPISIYIQEAESLHHWALEDKEALTAAGLAAKICG